MNADSVPGDPISATSCVCAVIRNPSPVEEKATLPDPSPLMSKTLLFVFGILLTHRLQPPAYTTRFVLS